MSGVPLPLRATPNAATTESGIRLARSPGERP